MALPTCCMVDSAPDTEPAVVGLAWASTVVVRGVMHSPWPAPSRNSPGNRSATEPPVPSWATAASKARSPAAASTDPMRMMRRPNRTVRAGARSEVTR